MAATGPKNTPPGPAVDASGQTVIDPTKNVETLVAAAERRQDDLLVAERRLRKAERAHSREIAELREKYAALLREAESKRIDANRQADVAAQLRATEVAGATATALAANVDVTATALREQVAAAAVTTEQRLIAALSPIQADIVDLRRTQWQGQGEKSQVVEARAEHGETQTSRGGVMQMIAIAISVMLGLGALAISAASLIALIVRG